TAIALFAIGAVAATSALAGAYHSEIETTNITGTQQTTNEFKTDMGTLKCTTVTYTGQLKGSKKAEKDYSAEMLTMSSKYEGCTLAGTKVNVTTTECAYTYTIPTSTIF